MSPAAAVRTASSIVRPHWPAAVFVIAGIVVSLIAAGIGVRSLVIVLAGTAATVLLVMPIVRMRPRAANDAEERASAMAVTLLADQFESVPDGILVIIDAPLRVSVNRNLARMLALPADVAALEDASELLAAVLARIKEPERLRADMEHLVREPKAPIHRDVEFVDGAMFELHAGTMQQTSGVAHGLMRFFVFHDIAERVRADRAAERANVLLQKQIDASPLGIVVDHAGIVTSLNQRFSDMFAVDPPFRVGAAVQPSLSAFLRQVPNPDEYLARTRSIVEHPAEDAVDEIAMSGGRCIERHSSELRGPDGESLGRIWFFNDITELRGATRRAEDERNFAGALLDSLPGYFVLIDAAGRLVRWNESLRLLNGLSADEIMGSDAFANIVASDRDAAMASFRQTIVDGAAEFEFGIHAKSGIRTIGWHTRRVIVDGEPHVLAIGNDVTDVRAADARLRASEERFRAIFDSVSDGIVVQDAATEAFLDVNPRECEMLGYTRDEFLALGPRDVTGGSREAAALRLGDLRAAPPASGRAFEWVFRAKDGREFWCEVARKYVNFGGRDVLLSTIRDVSERREAAAEVMYRDRILHALAMSTAELVRAPSLAGSMPALLEAVAEELGIDRILVIQRTAIEHESSGASVIYGWQRATAPHVDVAKISESLPDPLERLALATWLAPLFAGTPVVTQAASATGFVRKMMLAGQTLSSLLVPIFVGGAYWGHFAVDATERVHDWTPVETDALTTFADLVGALVMRQRIEASLDRMASHDALTGLPNRRRFIETLDGAIARARRSGGLFAVFSLDLDHFKDVNDTLGHPVGDRFLIAVAGRLRSSMRDVDMVARFGGDEFAAIQLGIHDPADAAVLAAKLVRVTGDAFLVDGNEVHSATSLGIAIYGPESPDAEALLAHADVALYRAKADGRGTYRFYTEAMDAEVRALVALDHELREALASQQFFLVYQPQVNVDGRIVGLEALVRWRHPTRGVVLPADFIPAVERNGLISALGAWIVGEACRQTAEWSALGIAPARIAVDLSPLQFRNPLELDKTITSIVAESGIPPATIELELTERALMEVARQDDDVLLRLRAMGFGIAIDDFGSGSSSLNSMRRFGIDRIKIPPSLIAGISVDSENAPVVRAIIQIASELGITVIAVGVETAAQSDLLRSWGCQDIQGYYFAKALPPDEIAPLLHAGTIVPAP